MLLKICLGFLVGAVLGLERESRGKPAGFRTTVLVAVGATLLGDLSILIGQSQAIGDPGRIASYTLASIGFIGGGAVIQSRGHVTGITTAATLWVVAALGIGLGANQFMAVLTVTFLALLTLTGLLSIERWMGNRRMLRTLHIRVEQGDEPPFAKVAGIVTSGSDRSAMLEAKRKGEALHLEYEVAVTGEGLDALVENLMGIPGLSVTLES